jgi:hypothetical protein
MADLAIAIKIATEDASSGPIGKIKASLGGLGEAVSAPGKALGGLVSGLGSLGLAAAGVGAAFDAVKGVGSLLGIGALNEMEQTRASFQAFTKDSAKTEEILAQVRKEAALTPFAFGEMAKATASLLPVSKASGAGLQDLVKQAEVLAASNPLEGLEGASFSLREAMTGDFTSIIERFNLSRSTINKLKEEGVPNLEIVRKAMAEMGFDSDLIAAKAETLDGRWSTFMDTLQTLQMRMGQPIFDAMKDGLSALQPLLDDNMATFEAWADSIAGAIKGVIEFAKTGFAGLVDLWGSLRENFEAGGFGGLLSMVTDSLGPKLASALENLGTLIATTVEEWATSFAAWVDGASDGQMSKLGEMAIAVEDWLLKTALVIVEKLGVWAGAFVDWIAPKIPPMLEALGGYLAEMAGWMLGTALPLILSKLVEWGTAFVDWVLPRIPPLLEALAELSLELLGWIGNTALPAILSKLLEWGAAFVGWVGPQIPPLLLEMAKLYIELEKWMLFTALPAIVLKLGEWADAFIKWVPGAVVNLLFELGKLEFEVVKWIGTAVLNLGKAALDLGAGFVKGIQDGIAGALEGFWTWLQTNFVDKIPSFVKSLLNINSPSGVFMDIGRNIVDGLRVGMEQRLPSVEDVISRLVGRVAVAGEVTDWLKAAIAITGAPESWLPGLERLAQWESTGNPRAVNETAVGNEHATGLMQTLPSTFRAYAYPGLDDIFNPIHNAVASIGRIRAAWDTPYDIPGIASGDHGEFGGYATGGIAWQPQLAYVAEREPELIVPLSRVRAGQAGGSGIDYDRLGQAVASRLGPMIAATRPINLIGTAEDQARKIRRELDGEARRMQAHHPIRGGRS